MEIQENTIHILDLNFLGIAGTIASYLIPHPAGAVLIESGPGSTLPGLLARLETHGLSPAQITDVLLTHIHLDHAGAAGWLARQGARIHVHPVGAPHLLNPEKLLASAARIYGDRMEALWGEFLAVPEDRLVVVEDGERLNLHGLRFQALDTPGHAEHHYVYLYENVCFSGDIGGVRLSGLPHLRLPMPPPEFHLEKWRASLERLSQASFSFIAPTHFGIYADTGWHLSTLARLLDDTERWMEASLPPDPPVEEINARFLEWTLGRGRTEGLTPAGQDAYEAANPSWMSGFGMQRYWRKHRGIGERG
jgi:glyoxylase-like metal-dependent hydrolase (beta-lactamase superfamily II)